jgi:hypothetical protein
MIPILGIPLTTAPFARMDEAFPTGLFYVAVV